MPTFLPEPAELEVVKRAAKSAQIAQLCALPQNSTKGTIAICVVRNEINRLPEFFDHHRSLGFERFVFIDNGSSDGTREYLLQQCDTGVFATSDIFHWTAKHGWIMQVIERLGQTRWYALLDADEHLVFAHCESHTIHQFVSGLQARGIKRARACLVDMYNERAVFGASDIHGTFEDRYRYYDAKGYSEHRSGRLTVRTGGPRARMADSLGHHHSPALTKYPVFQMDKGEVAYNPHVIWPPLDTLTDPCLLALKHYKFDDALSQKMDYALKTGAYWNDSAEYALYKDWNEQNPDKSLLYSGSARYQCAQDFAECGLIEGMDELSGERSINDRLAHARSLGRAGHFKHASEPLQGNLKNG